MTMTITPTETEQAPLPAWSIHWRGQVFHESELSGKHLSVLSLLAGNDNFEMLDMNPGLGHQRLMMMITTFLAVEAVADLEPDAAAEAIAVTVKTVADAPAEEILGSIRFE